MWVLVHIFHLGHVLPEGLRDTRALILGVVPEQASLLVVDAAHRQAQVLVRDDRVRRLRTVNAGGKFFFYELILGRRPKFLFWLPRLLHVGKHRNKIG